MIIAKAIIAVCIASFLCICPSAVALDEDFIKGVLDYSNRQSPRIPESSNDYAIPLNQNTNTKDITPSETIVIRSPKCKQAGYRENDICIPEAYIRKPLKDVYGKNVDCLLNGINSPCRIYWSNAVWKVVWIEKGYSRLYFMRGGNYFSEASSSGIYISSGDWKLDPLTQKLHNRNNQQTIKIFDLINY